MDAPPQAELQGLAGQRDGPLGYNGLGVRRVVGDALF